MVYDQYFIESIENLIVVLSEKYANIQPINLKHELGVQKFASITDTEDNQSRFDLTVDEVENKLKITNANVPNDPLAKGEKVLSRATL